MKIEIKEDKIIFEFPATQPRYNPYDDQSYGTHPTFTGLIIKHRKDGNHFDEMGFAYTIDMDYKDKPDQVGDFAVMWDGEEEDFVKKCEELEIGIHEIEV